MQKIYISVVKKMFCPPDPKSPMAKKNRVGRIGGNTAFFWPNHCYNHGPVIKHTGDKLSLALIG